jgi:hypothetical protein
MVANLEQLCCCGIGGRKRCPIDRSGRPPWSYPSPNCHSDSINTGESRIYNTKILSLISNNDSNKKCLESELHVVHSMEPEEPMVTKNYPISWYVDCAYVNTKLALLTTIPTIDRCCCWTSLFAHTQVLEHVEPTRTKSK